MRIFGSNATARAAAAGAPRRAASGGFSVADGDSPAAAGSVGSPRAIGGIDALMALQGEGGPTERRRRAVRRGRVALDALDQLKVDILGGGSSAHALTRLRSASAELAGVSGDPGLDGVLAEIALRLEVEIAKITVETAPRAAPGR